MSEEKSKRGLFIVFEGLDRSGKTTQSLKLKENIPGSKLYRFPDRTTKIGAMLSSILSGESTLPLEARHLLFTANRWEVIEKIKKDLDSGTTVIVDRYLFSGIVYSVASGLDIEWCFRVEETLLLPDIVIYMNINPHEAAKRGDYGKEVFEVPSFQTKVENAYKKLSKAYSFIWREIDASGTVDTVAERVNKLYSEIRDKTSKPFTTTRHTLAQ